MNKRTFTKIAIPFLVLVGIFLTTVSFSGCISGAKECPIVVSQTDALVITRLEPSYDLIPVGDSVSLVAEIQNKGMAEAKNIKVTLWSAPGFKILDADAVKDGITPAGSAASYQDKTKKTMAPPRLDICSAGDTQVVQWQLQARCDPRETPLAVAVEYDYTGEGWASIFLVNAKEAEKVGGKFSEKGENSPSAGPVQVKIEPLQTEPVILSDGAQSFDVRIKFKNTGDGVVGHDASGELDKVELNIEGPCRFSGLNAGLDSKHRTVFWQQSWRTQITLRSAEQETFKVAKIDFAGNDFDTFVKDFCRINAHMEYEYRTVQDVTKTVGITGSASQVKNCLCTSLENPSDVENCLCNVDAKAQRYESGVCATSTIAGAEDLGKCRNTAARCYGLRR